MLSVSCCPIGNKTPSYNMLIHVVWLLSLHLYGDAFTCIIHPIWYPVIFSRLWIRNCNTLWWVYAPLFHMASDLRGASLSMICHRGPYPHNYAAQKWWLLPQVSGNGSLLWLLLNCILRKLSWSNIQDFIISMSGQNGGSMQRAFSNA